MQDDVIKRFRKCVLNGSFQLQITVPECYFTEVVCGHLPGVCFEGNLPNTCKMIRFLRQILKHFTHSHTITIHSFLN